tara:strand:+ start:1740 stop:2708 length:969 start_codon:yes stop_codon:yes gene_type:complete
MSNYCYNLSKNKLSQDEIDKNNKIIYSYLLKELKIPNFKNISSNLVKKTFKIIDKVYFNNNISKRITETNSSLTFSVSNKLTTTAGRCDYRYWLDENKNFLYGNYDIKISKPIIENIFSKKEKSLKINGLSCFDRLECYINLFQHEIIHLLINLFCYEEGVNQGGHTNVFKSIVYNLFGHTDYKHLLLSGDSKELEELELFNRTNIEIGDYVISKSIKNNTFEGYVFKLTKNYVYFELNDKRQGIRYDMIKEIKKNKDKKLIKTSVLSDDEIKKKLKVGDIIKVKLNDKIQNGEIVSINKSRATVIMEDGKKWYIPYRLIII